jgi:integrative and conjugative element protein (TIGR02256 family)
MQRGIRLQIAATVLESITSTIRSSDPHLETGGALFGPASGSRVLHAVKPGPLAEHGPLFFQRDLTFTEQEAKRLYQADGSQWIGEWHTHINAPPIPSDVDLHTYARHITDGELKFDRFVALIIATSGPQPMLAAWALERRSGQIILIDAGSTPLNLWSKPGPLRTGST